MADETASGAEDDPAAATDGIAFVVALPGELRAGQTFAGPRSGRRDRH